jgi:alpha-D-ribose 1-methylphosphonate 5-triphosphate synthase subunit PhnG
MAVLSQAILAQLEGCFSSLEDIPAYHFLRSPEIGLAMVRGRTAGTGAPFNLGEMTITRCVVQVPGLDGDAIAGFGYVAGRSRRHAELAAVCDALLQHPDWRDRVQAQVIAPLAAAAEQQATEAAAQVESTQVNFFTLLRGEG